MIKKTVRLLVAAGAGTALALGWRDIRRYLTIRQVSSSGAHPERIPAGGRIAYPQNRADGQPDGTGDFDSARRGGPALG